MPVIYLKSTVCEPHNEGETPAIYYNIIHDANLLSLKEKHALGECMPCTEDDAPLYICGKASSSLDVAWHLVSQDVSPLFPKDAMPLLSQDILPLWGAVQAMAQESGRGQLRRAWASPLGNVHLALRIPNTPPFDGLAGASAMGILLCMALESLGFACRMKWPNDLIVQEHDGVWRKFGGILLEERNGILLAGIGLNRVASPSVEALRPNALLEATRLANVPSSDASPSGLGAFIQTLVSRLRICYATCLNASTPWHSYAPQYTAFVGVCVRIVDEGHLPVQGICLGISESGALRLVVDGVEQEVFSGSLVAYE